MEQVLDFLKNPVWPEGLDGNASYVRQHDDTDGGDDGQLIVEFLPYGDIMLSIDYHKIIRFRNFSGGGRSPKTYAALLILAKAIQMDNERIR